LREAGAVHAQPPIKLSPTTYLGKRLSQCLRLSLVQAQERWYIFLWSKHNPDG